MTDRALYLPVFRASPFRPRKCWRIPTELIAGVAVRPWRLSSLLFVGGVAAIVICFSVILFAIFSSLPEFALGPVIENSAPAVVVAAFTVMAMSMSDSRAEFNVSLRDGRKLRFITPADSYIDEKRYDREVLDQALQACRGAGLRCS